MTVILYVAVVDLECDELAPVELIDYLFLHSTGRVAFSTNALGRVQKHVDDLSPLLVVKLGVVEVLVVPANHLEFDHGVAVQFDGNSHVLLLAKILAAIRAFVHKID